MLGIDYDSSADLWSLGCMIFELITADFLFEPRKGEQSGYGKSDDHLAQMMELLGPMPKSNAMAGKQFDKFFNYDSFTKKYTFSRIQGLKHCPLQKLLMDKYRLKPTEAQMLADFLLPML